MSTALCLILAAAAQAKPLPDPPHFPDRLHAFVWRNWTLVPAERMARVLGSKPEEVLALGTSLGLPPPPAVSEAQARRSYLTIIRRNWHLLPYDQLLELLGWTREHLDFILREDDFLYIKLGSSKPACSPLRFAAPGAAARERAAAIASTVAKEFPGGAGRADDPPFAFVGRLSAAPAKASPRAESRFSPRFCYSYFALYGDPLLEKEADPYPDGYLARLAESGVDGVWIQGLLFKLSPFPWEPKRSEGYEERRRNLRALVERARRHGIGIHLYLNEPRALPASFYAARPELKGVVEGDHAALCTSHADVKAWLADSVASLLKDVPDLAGIFTITASENLTNCWSHGRGSGCAPCGMRPYAEVIAEVNAKIQEGMTRSGSAARLIVWDWGWNDAHAAEIIDRLPTQAAFMSVSEWGVPIAPGGVRSSVGEYSISAVGPGPRARRHWELARKRGLKTIAKIQAANTWELSSVPYVPALENVARHVEGLRAAGVDGLMLGWTLGGYPSPNLEVVAELGRTPPPTVEEALGRVARKRAGEAAPDLVRAWTAFSAAFREFPFHVGTVYRAPLQYGPSNLLWEVPTGRPSTMIGFPYDDLDGWRAVYPPEIFAAQLEKVARGFEDAAAALRGEGAVAEERRLAEASAVHFRTTANQSRFVLARGKLASARTADEARPVLASLERLLKDEIEMARRLHALQGADSRIGFEASNHYYYVPQDLAEKVLNCRDLLDRWLPAQRAKW